MSSYESNGALLHFERTGQGLPVVFLHPTPFHHGYWGPLMAALPEVLCIAPDLRGHGASPLLGTGQHLPVGEFQRVPDAPALTMDQLAADILRMMDAAEIDQAAFVGCSIGGYILLELWRRAPERMSALAFICSKPQPDTEAALVQRLQTIERIRVEGAQRVQDGMVHSLVGDSSQRQRPAIVAELRSQMTLDAEALIAVQAGLAIRPDSRLTVATLSVPVLAIAGGEDKVCPLAEMQAFTGAPGGCEMHLLPEAGHLAAYERPEAVAALVAPWLLRIGGSRRRR